MDWNDGMGFSPIGTEYKFSDGDIDTFTIYPFQGYYNGNNHIISNLYINRQRDDTLQHSSQLQGVGLFGLVWHSTISNVRLENVTITMSVINIYMLPSWQQGMLISSANHSSILNCSARGSDINSYGLIGSINNNSIVEYCYSITYSDIKVSSFIQKSINSIVRNSFIRGCTKYENIARDYGLVGHAINTRISNVYIASLNGETNVNWLAGNNSEIMIENSYWDKETSNTPNPNDGFPDYGSPYVIDINCVGLLTAQMKLSSLYYVGWDFVNIWAIDPTINDGFPYFRHERIAQSLVLYEMTAIATKPSLLGNYPNPFNPETTIQYSLAETGKVKITVYNIKGQQVRTLVNEIKERGHHTVVWFGNDNRAKKVSSGVYFYKMETKSVADVKKMLLLK